jgi:hypothetical protein
MQVASSTGGREFQSNDLVKGVRQALVESSSYYLLGYEMPEGDLTERRVKVHVRRDGLTVRAPQRYFTQPLAQEVDPEDAELDAVYDATDLPVRVRSLLGGVTPDGEVEVTLVVEVGSVGGKRADAVSVRVEARSADGGPALRGGYETELPREEGPALTNVGLKIQPGVWQARVIVEEKPTGRLGSVLHTFEVTPGSALRVTTPFISDELVDGVSPRLRVDWTFPEDHPVFCGFGVWGAQPDPGTGAPDVRAHYALSLDGALVQEGDTTLSRIGDIMLWGRATFAASSLAPGRYTLRIEATDAVSGASSAVQETFSITLPLT